MRTPIKRYGTVGGNVVTSSAKWLIAVSVLLLISSFVATARAQFTWTGEGENPGNQVRNWIIPPNWSPPGPPLPLSQLTFDIPGDGTILLAGPELMSSLDFRDFTYTDIDQYNQPPNGPLILDPDAQGPGRINTGEGMRDTYGADYFTAGPRINTQLDLGVPDLSSILLDIRLGVLAGAASSDQSAMMITGPIINSSGSQSVVNYVGYGNGSSLWITSNNSFVAAPITVNVVSSVSPAASADGYALVLADDQLTGTSGHLDQTTINLIGPDCHLGFRESQGIAPVGNTYINDVNINDGGNLFADRTYQGNDLDTAVNLWPTIDGTVTVVGPRVDFGGSSPTTTFGRTNNGYGLEISRLDYSVDTNIRVNNGNLTEQRGGSRYVSGANRLQEPHNTTHAIALMQGNQLPMIKSGRGVLWVSSVFNGFAFGPNWVVPPIIQEGVVRVGAQWMAMPAVMPGPVVLNQSTVGTWSDAAVGINWNNAVASDTVDLSGQFNLGVIAPFPVTAMAAGAFPGQAGAFDIDVWDHGIPLFGFSHINTNLGPVGDPDTIYLRVGSSMGADADFDPQPQQDPSGQSTYKHAMTRCDYIVPYVNPGGPLEATYYFGGGGGTLRVDTVLKNTWPEWQEEYVTALEMGTTGALLPGRVALNPGGDEFEEPNQYTGPTDIRAGTLQLMKQGSIWGTSSVSLGTYNTDILSGLYDYTAPPAARPFDWRGPSQLLLDAGRTGALNDWDLGWYLTQQGLQTLGQVLTLDGGVIGWTSNVDLSGVPGAYGAPINSDLATFGAGTVSTSVLGLGGEYSSGTMTAMPLFIIADQQNPVLLYKAGRNSVLDLTQGLDHMYTGGTIIAGGEVRVSRAEQLNAGVESPGTGGPILILNGGRLRVTEDTTFTAPIMVNTDGTPDRIRNAGSVVEIDFNKFVALQNNFDFRWNPGAYLEKDGDGVLNYATPVMGGGLPNAWGLKLTKGIVLTNQLPVIGAGGVITGPVIFNDGDLEITTVPLGTTLDTDPAYGFRNLVSMAGTNSAVTIVDNALFRTHGLVPNEIMGTVRFQSVNTDGDPSNNVVHLSRNTSAGVRPGDASRGTGRLEFTDVTVYMTGGGINGDLNVLPAEAGFQLILNDGAVFRGSQQNIVNGEVNFNGVTLPVRIDGAEASPTPMLGTPPPYYTYTLNPQTWAIGGTGLTAWAGTIEKFGPGSVQFLRSSGAPVSVSATPLLVVSGGTLDAGGTGDPFTDTVLGNSLDVQCNSTSSGFVISAGNKAVGNLDGAGNTTIVAGASLTANHIVQNHLTIGAGGLVSVRLNGSETSHVNNLTINTTSGALDLADNDLIVTSETYTTIQGYVNTGYAAGAWNGPGIHSSAAAAGSTTGLAVLLNDTGGPASPTGTPIFTNWGGFPVTATDVLVKYAYLGDLDFDGDVDDSDLNLLLSNYTTTGGATWSDGDLNYDTNVDVNDLNLLLANFGITPPLGPEEVPEPSSLILLSLGLLGVLRLVRRPRRET